MLDTFQINLKYILLKGLAYNPNLPLRYPKRHLTFLNNFPVQNVCQRKPPKKNPLNFAHGNIDLKYKSIIKSIDKYL